MPTPYRQQEILRSELGMSFSLKRLLHFHKLRLTSCRLGCEYVSTDNRCRSYRPPLISNITLPMAPKSITILLVLLLLLVTAQAQSQTVCDVQIVVSDTQLVPNTSYGIDSVRFQLQGTSDADSLHWYPDSLFSDPTASSQWVTLQQCQSLSLAAARLCSHPYGIQLLSVTYRWRLLPAP